MSKSMLKIYVRVFTKKMNEGSTFEEVASQYPKLTKSELNEIESELEKQA